MSSWQRCTSARAGPASTVLLLVDWINLLDSDGAEELAGPALAAAQATARLKSRLASMGVPCIYANDNDGRWRSDLQDMVAHCRQRGSESAAIADLLAPRGDDLCVIKPGQSAFYETPLQLLLQRLAAREIVLTGLVSEGSVLFSAMDAYERGYRVWAPRDCMASASEEGHYAALRYMQDVLRFKIDLAEPAARGTMAPMYAAAPLSAAAGERR